MASNLPLELEDQTDEDFFDKLVNDDDDVSSKNIRLTKADMLNGDGSDEVKDFANLSIGEISRGNSGSELAREKENDDNSRVEPRRELIVDGEANSTSASSKFPILDEVPLLEEDGVTLSEGNSDLRRESSCLSATAVKEVQWTAFTESAMHDISGVGSYDDFFTDLGEGDMDMGSFQTQVKAMPRIETNSNAIVESSYHADYNGTAISQPSIEGDTYSIEYWESVYPGWKYDPNTAQWYQLYGNDGSANGQEHFGVAADTLDAGANHFWGTFDDQSSQVRYAQQMAKSVSSHFSSIESVSGWNYMLPQNGSYQYPAHMIFDPHYPGWYYDTITQEWHSLEAYHASAQSIDRTRNLQTQNGFSSTSSWGINNYGQQVSSSEGLKTKLASSFVNYGQQDANAQFGSVNNLTVNPSAALSWKSSGDSNIYSNRMSQQISSDSTGALTLYEKTSQSNNDSNWLSGMNNVKDFHLFDHAPQVQQNGPAQYPIDYYSSRQEDASTQPLIPNDHYLSYSPSEGRSSAGRPPHALVAFAFGGKLVVLKDNKAGAFSTLGNKNNDGCTISVLNLMEVVSLNNGPPGTEANSYFHSLCHQSFPGPLVGGNVGSKELNKWIDESIVNCESLDMSYGKGQSFKLLLSLLKIACQHYGKLRSFGIDAGPKENDYPESAVAKLFASAKENDDKFGEYNTISKCLMTLPSEAHIQTTATEVQNLLISGRKVEALQRAQEGQFWGFALILSRELGEQFYADTVKQMAVSHLAVASPLRTLCLLIAKKPEEVFSNSMMSSDNVYGAVHTSPEPVQNAGCSMLDKWEENLAVITSNKTENDHLVIIHLGDCLLRERNDVAAAHICYLVAEAAFESYSDSARLCLIGADHWNFPRAYASPEAIQRTELFEYAKVLGNSQFVLPQLQPYKLVYAHMLAEVGRLSDSLKYCQAVLKSLKIGRSPEADTLKQLLSSLEERVRTHQQSGYVANLARGKIVGKLLNFIDSTAHRVVGGLPPPGPSPSTIQSSFQGNENQFQTLGPKFTGSQSTMGVSTLTPPASLNITSGQSTMGMSSLMPSASMEPISQWAVDQSKMTLQNRSISEPDIGRTPRPDQANSSNEVASSSTVGKQSGSTGTSRFGRFNLGAQILQKTVGFVLKPRQGRQAKLGDANKFYFDDKLKRWVEEGAEPAPEGSALPPPPPMTAAFQSGKSDYNLKDALNDGSHGMDGSPGSVNVTPESIPGIPSTLPSSNQFSARGRMGVRSRYVDTFNKGGNTSTNLFQAPSVLSAKSSSFTTGAKFFIPAVPPANYQTSATESGSRDEISEIGENSSRSTNDPFQNLAPSPVGTMQRFPSVGNIPSKGMMENGRSSLPHQSRRAASWSAIQSDKYSLPSTSEIKSSPLSFMPSSNHLPGSPHIGGDNSGDDLHEVEL